MTLKCNSIRNGKTLSSLYFFKVHCRKHIGIIVSCDKGAP